MAKILVIDDDKTILEVVNTILDNEGYVVETISDWPGVFEKIKSYKPHLIILDIFISGADGRVICKELKKSKTTLHIPVILFSATNRLEAYTKDSNAQGYLKKPFEPEDLINVVKECLHLGPVGNQTGKTGK
ncbi:MAG TPA: response regulator [Chitinophagaceae bacterium]|nr:response regulator [Chitinophagaceae bacterium]